MIDDNESNSDIIYVVSWAYLFIVGITGIFLNVAALIKAMKAQKTQQNLVITNLIVSELLISVVGVPLDLIGTAMQGRALETVLCPTTAFAHTLFGMSSIYTLVTMALIRYSSVVRFERSWHTTTHDDFFTSRYVHAIWVLSLLIAIPPTFGIGKYTPDVGLISCGPDWATSDLFDLIYNWYLMICGFFIPTVILVVSNVLVVRTSNKQAEIREKYKKLSVIASFPQEKKSSRIITRHLNKERKVAILVGMMTVSFYLVWTPYAVTSLLIMASSSVSRIPTVVSILFAKSGTVINPILYIFFNKDIAKSRSNGETPQKLSTHPPKSNINNYQGVLGYNFRSMLELIGPKNVNEDTPKIPRNNKLRRKSYYNALRESFYIDFETAGSYSYWNHQYYNVDRRSSFVGDDYSVVLDSDKMDIRSIKSV